MSEGKNARLAGTVIKTAAGIGVKNFVICAGARNVPLIQNLTETESRAGRIWHHFDERSAAFFALGLSKRNHEPVAIVTTSGTAVAELLPAVVEAWYTGLPLVLITADRPVSFRGTGAPQAIEQTGIFGGYVSHAYDLEYKDSLSLKIEWDFSSPLHFNVCFQEPIEEAIVDSAALKTVKVSDPIESSQDLWPDLENPVAIVGELRDSPPDRETVRHFLRETGIPAWLECHSGLREDLALKGQLLRTEFQLKDSEPAEIIRIGGVPSCRYWRDLENLTTVKVLNFVYRPFPGLSRTENVHTYDFSQLYSVPSPRVQCTQQCTQQCTVNDILKRHPTSEPALVHSLSDIIPQSAAVFLGNSLPIREWNLFANRAIPHPACFANRGANGIDGELSTYLGISESYEESWGIFGDLTALYDLNAPWVLNQLSTGSKRRIVVLNNRGGRIFSRLPAIRQLPQSSLAIAENHHGIEFRHWADMWGMEYCSWNDQADSWSLPENENALIEIEIDQSKSEKFWADFSTIS